MANDYRSVNDDIKDEVISIPTVIGNHTFIHKMVEDVREAIDVYHWLIYFVSLLKILDDLNDELDDPLVEPKAVKFIKKDYHFTIRVSNPYSIYATPYLM